MGSPGTGTTEKNPGQKKAAHHVLPCLVVIELVGGAGFEPATSTV
jgi:hypothetical protein